MVKRLFLVGFLLLQLATARSQVAGVPETENRKTSTPYTGDLSIFDSPGREERLQIDRVMNILGIASGKTVADIGAGSGWFTIQAAKRAGDSGVVYAVDINPMPSSTSLPARKKRTCTTSNRFSGSPTIHSYRQRLTPFCC